MEDEYGMPDLRHYMGSRPLFPSPDLLPTHARGLGAAAHPYDMLIFRSDSPAAPNNASAAAFAGFDGTAGRWPRQETLTLLEIRSKLDPKFKEANQKGPLWDEVSRIMSEEHGYQRSGKKCREKFENLYKYYKKTKEGKAGRQDGKHYRFFRQLEALYGEANNSASMSETHAYNHPSNFSNSLTLSNYSVNDSGTSDGSGDGGDTAKIKDIIDAQMKKLMEKQEAWMEKMMKAIEDKERERVMREEEWRKQDIERIEKEHKFWANERAWIEARDAALMEALRKLTNKESSSNDDGSETMTNAGDIWPECEIDRLIRLRTAMEGKLQQRGVEEEMVWEEIAAKMGYFGHDRSGVMCKEKWDSVVNNYVLKCSKKRRDQNSNQGEGGGVHFCEQRNDDNHHIISLSHDHGSSSSHNLNTANAGISESCFRYFMGDAYGRI